MCEGGTHWPLEPPWAIISPRGPLPQAWRGRAAVPPRLGGSFQVWPHKGASPDTEKAAHFPGGGWGLYSTCPSLLPLPPPPYPHSVGRIL